MIGRIRELIGRHPRDALAVGAILFVLFGLTLHWAPRSVWTPDALLYQSKVVDIQGGSYDEALDEVWSGPLSQAFRAGDAQRAPGTRALDDPRWIDYLARSYDRRVVVPALAVLVDPIAGDDSLELVSIVGVFVFALLLYAMLRLRFGPAASAIAVGLCLAWPPMRWAFLPLTEGWGMALVVLALLAGVLFAERGGRWLWVWAASILILSFTRDLTPVPVIAAVAFLVFSPGPRQWRLAISGVLAALPAPLLGGAPLRETLALSFNNNRIPEDSSWGYVIDHYWGAVEGMIRHNVELLFDSHPPFMSEAWPLLPFTIPLLVGVVLVVAARVSARSDPVLALARGSIIGAVVYLALLPGPTYLRRELAFLPAAAIGIAIGVELLIRRTQESSRTAGEVA